MKIIYESRDYAMVFLKPMFFKIKFLEHIESLRCSKFIVRIHFLPLHKLLRFNTIPK